MHNVKRFGDMITTFMKSWRPNRNLHIDRRSSILGDCNYTYKKSKEKALATLRKEVLNEHKWMKPEIIHIGTERCGSSMRGTDDWQ